MLSCRKLVETILTGVKSPYAAQLIGNTAADDLANQSKAAPSNPSVFSASLETDARALKATHGSLNDEAVERFVSKLHNARGR